MQRTSERYSRQILLNAFGEAAQQKLLAAKVLVIGAGGLGCPVLQYLAAAGMGTIGIVDGDKISVSNLQRQVLYNMDEIGASKVSVAATKLRLINPEIKIVPYNFFIDTKNALELIRRFDIIVDGTDNFSARYLINDACSLLKKPLIFGAVYQYEGQVAVFNIAGENGASINYRHLFPVPPSAEEAPDCAAAGVLGTVPGTIGMMQATEVIKLITGVGNVLSNKMLTWNALNNESIIIDLMPSFGIIKNAPENETAFEQMNYDVYCGVSHNNILQINAAEFFEMLKNQHIAIIDVREPNEKPLANFRHTQIPLSVFKNNMNGITADDVVLFCHSGIRSLVAAELLAGISKNKRNIYNLKGGILTL